MIKTPRKNNVTFLFTCVCLIGAGVLLALWWQDGFPGWRLIGGAAASFGLIILLLHFLSQSQGGVRHAATVATLFVLSVIGAFTALTWLADFFAGLLRSSGFLP